VLDLCSRISVRSMFGNEYQRISAFLLATCLQRCVLDFLCSTMSVRSMFGNEHQRISAFLSATYLRRKKLDVPPAG